MIINVEGEEKSGKSSFAYTAPLPIVVFSTDLGHQRAIFGKLYPEFFDELDIKEFPYKKPKLEWKNGQANAKVEYEPFTGHDITIYELPTPLQMDPNGVEGFMAQWSYMLTIYIAAMQDPAVSTVIMDTMTLVYKNKCDAYLEELNTRNGSHRKQLLQVEYGHPNESIRSLYDFARASDKNLVTVHHLRDHYVNRPNSKGEIESQPDGTMETDGMRETGKKVDIVLRIEKKDGKLYGRMPTCGPNLAMENMPILNPTWDTLMDMVEMGWYGPKFPRRSVKKESAK